MDTSRESLPASRKGWVFWAAVVVVRMWTFGVEFGLEAGELVRVRGGCLPHIILPVNTAEMELKPPSCVASPI